MAEKNEIKNVRRFLIFPILVIGILSVVILPDFWQVGLTIFVLSLTSLVVYNNPEYQKDLIGIKGEGNFFTIWFSKKNRLPIILGVIFAVGFYILNSLLPSFAIGFPTLSLSINSNIRWFFIVILFPILESIFFLSVLIALMKRHWKVSENKAIIIQMFFFMAFHLLAYGVIFGAFETWTELFGTLTGTIGLFVSAGIMGFLWARVSRDKKIKNILFAIVSHMIINGILFSVFIGAFFIG